MLHFHNFSRLALKYHELTFPIKFNNTIWEAISLSVNFTENSSQYFVLLGRINIDERLFVDTKSKLITALVEEISKQCTLKTHFDILTLVSKTIDNYTTLHPSVIGEDRETIEENLDARVDTYLEQRKKGLIPGKPANLDITIDELMEAGLLNCVHKGLIAAVVIGKLIEKKILPFGSSRLYRSTIHIKGNGYNAGHAWAVYNAKSMWVVDPRWESVQKVDRNKPSKLGYGKFPAREMIKRIEQLDNPSPSHITSTSASSSAVATSSAPISTENPIEPPRKSYELASKLIPLYLHYGHKYYIQDMQEYIDLTCKNMMASNQTPFMDTLTALNIPYEIDCEFLKIRIEKSDFNTHYDPICSTLKKIETLQRILTKKIERATTISALMNILSQFTGYIKSDEGAFMNVKALINAIQNKNDGIEDEADLVITHNYGLAQKVDTLIQQQLQANSASEVAPSTKVQQDLPPPLSESKPVDEDTKQEHKLKRRKK